MDFLVKWAFEHSDVLLSVKPFGNTFEFKYPEPLPKLFNSQSFKGEYGFYWNRLCLTRKLDDVATFGEFYTSWQLNLFYDDLNHGTRKSYLCLYSFYGNRLPLTRDLDEVATFDEFYTSVQLILYCRDWNKSFICLTVGCL